MKKVIMLNLYLNILYPSKILFTFGNTLGILRSFTSFLIKIISEGEGLNLHQKYVEKYKANFNRKVSR